MIKNIIFDMGNVLLRYDPEVCLNRFVKREEDRALIRRELFEGPEWVQGDLGHITDEQRFDGVSRRVPQKLHTELRQCVEQWHMCMEPVHGAKEFCAYAKEQGYRLYVLSNASSSFYQYFPRFAPFEYFDGLVVSCDIHIVKPDIRIYRYLLETYGLAPEECFFIDDMAANVEGARKAGISGAVFGGDFEEIRKKL
ncbi:MAG: HAD family phosphatase [Ruminococcus sp.]|uniref:HAD family phosphatase n=1 Tax=Schaedlerella arabinosiphila TaxID=2044587 RepID=A0A3R8JLD3_9FIRM|nr:HAD family phosphatase [Schaedlerella arabinosiphila]MCI8722702.1 HAD family phosphatase [Ruminococcus sp.]RRK31554.1 HAD family phosphatase [Schaedlerella arabinosiphila]